jgi:hypothetical protein
VQETACSFPEVASLARGDLPTGWYAVEALGGDGSIIGRALVLFLAP